jgi:methyl-accepting chemotaxis protein
MFVNWSIKKRVLVSAISVCLASITILGIFAYRHQIHQLREGVKEMASNEGRLFRSILSADAEGLARAHTGLDRLDGLLRPFAAGSKDQVLAAAQPIFNEVRQNNNITHMYFIEPDGKVLLRVHKPQESGDILNRITFRKARDSKALASGLEMGKNFFSLRCVRPVTFQGRGIGYMEVAEEIDHIFKQMKEITGHDESLFLTEEFLSSKATDVKSDKVGNFRILYPTNKEVAVALAARLLPEMREALRAPKVEMVSYNGAKYAVGISPVQDASGATVGVLFSQKDVTPLFASVWTGVIANLAIVMVVMSAGMFLLYLSLRRSLALFNALRRHIVSVTTNWDLSRRLEVQTQDEVGQLAEDFNEMTGKLAEMVRQVNASSSELVRVSSALIEVSGMVMSAAEQQATSVGHASSAMTQINGSIKGVTDGVESLSLSASESSSSILEMAASVEEVALSAESLSSTVSEVGSSIIEMAASIKQVGDNANRLMEAANVNLTSIAEMDGSIKEVERNALETASISESVRSDAEIGKEAVDSTIRGIKAIKASSKITSEVIATLSKRAGDIGAILSVIDEVASRTNLLALNAAIIAAQAGEHGKGFAVVAGEIKELANRTSSSTREIADVIHGVMEETERAVAAIGEAEKNISEGEALSRKSGEALEKIVNGVEVASRQIATIARATAQQARGSMLIRESTGEVTDMVRQIATAVKQQAEGGRHVLTSVERMKSMTEQVKNSTREQSNVGGFIAKSTESITDMIRRIKNACDEQSRGSEQVLPAVASIREAADSNMGAVKMLGESMSTLTRQIAVLQQEIDRFKADEAAGEE